MDAVVRRSNVEMVAGRSPVVAASSRARLARFGG